MTKVNMMIEGPETDEYANWISMTFDMDDEDDWDFALTLQSRAIDQGLSVRMKKQETLNCIES